MRESVPGKSMVVTDVLTGEQRLVQEAQASRSLVARDAILTRVVDLGADSALRRQTPRQAARSRRGREELALLLKQIENREAHQEADARFDVGVLRRELGIEE